MPGWAKVVTGTALGVITTGLLSALAWLAVEGVEHDTTTQPAVLELRLEVETLGQTVGCMACKDTCLAGCRQLTKGDPDETCPDHCAGICRVECGT